MGADALRGNGITQKILYFLRDKTLTSQNDPLRKVRKSRILMFVAIQLGGFGATFAITQTIGKLWYIFVSSPVLIPLSCHRVSCHYHAAHSSAHAGHSTITIYK